MGKSPAIRNCNVISVPVAAPGERIIGNEDEQSELPLNDVYLKRGTGEIVRGGRSRIRC